MEGARAPERGEERLALFPARLRLQSPIVDLRREELEPSRLELPLGAGLLALGQRRVGIAEEGQVAARIRSTR